ncbi:hypothetical protein ACQ86N_23635 [Puia sp. P3]|uniref:hypothetical protein n=1 Tax=Puia sp. P3 TaxID=3423952 RepID=UPI003D67CDBA
MTTYTSPRPSTRRPSPSTTSLLLLTDSAAVEGYCHADTIRLQSDLGSTIFLSGSPVKMVRTKLKTPSL